MVVGWYHSHPGFGCWFSGTDVNTQQSFEQLNPRAVGVVVDPIQSVKGKVSPLLHERQEGSAGVWAYLHACAASSIRRQPVYLLDLSVFLRFDTSHHLEYGGAKDSKRSFRERMWAEIASILKSKTFLLAERGTRKESTIFCAISGHSQTPTCLLVRMMSRLKVTQTPVPFFWGGCRSPRIKPTPNEQTQNNKKRKNVMQHSYHQAFKHCTCDNRVAQLLASG